MQTLVHHCKYNHSSSPLNSFDSLHLRTLAKSQSFCTPFLCCTTRISIFSKNNNLKAFRRNTHFSFCSKNDTLDGLSSEVAIEDGDSLARENSELGLLDKPFPMPRDEVEEPSLEASEEERAESVNEDEALAPFLKFFNQTTETDEAVSENEPNRESVVLDLEYEVENRVGVEYYDPKAGDFAVGVVVSGNENKLDVHVGADLLGTMLTKEVLPLYGKEIEFLRCDPGSEDLGDFSYAPGRMGVVGYRGEPEPVDGRPVVEPGTVLFVEVLGRTLSGRPLLSCRRLFRRISWHRLRQIQQLNEPIEVRITEWNTGGLLTRLEGLRAFIPKAELMKRVNNFSELKEKVGSPIRVLITRINDEKNDLILSEKEAWQMTNLREGALLEGAVRKVFPYGVQIRIGETNRSGLLHISNITKGKISSVKDVFAVGDKVKVLVVKSMFPDKISLSIADLESEPGLFVSDKERVFSEAEMMAKKFREKLAGNMTTERSKSGPASALAFENEDQMYANWKWFKFERDNNQND